MDTPDMAPITTTALVTTAPPLPEPVTRRGISEAQWRTLMNSLFPGAKGESVLMVWDYCLSRKLDPMKKPCHIVQIDVKVGNNYEKRDVVMPGVYELRTTAQRTGLYLGHSKPEYGPEEKVAGVTAPAWCEMTMYRHHPACAGQRAEFPVRVLFAEVVATKNDGRANARWTKAPVQMLTKCCEAAGLREAFPDEMGGISTEEEMDGQRVITVTATAPTESGTLVKPDGYDDWLTDLTAAADNGDATLKEAWKGAKPFLRHYLMATEPDAWDSLKARAESVDQAAVAVGEVAE
jgi:phage recombination protein Bet